MRSQGLERRRGARHILLVGSDYVYPREANRVMRDLVERQGGTVVGLAAVAIEENAATDAYRAKYRCVSGVVQGSRWQAECNAQKLESFKSYRPELVFPTVR